MSSALCVLPVSAPSGTDERPAAGPQSGFEALEQTLISLTADARRGRSTGSAEEVLFVLSGDGELVLGEERHGLEAESGARVSPGQAYELHAGPDGLRLVSVRIPSPGAAAGDPVSVRHLTEQATEEATTDREFRVVAAAESATAFVGYIPTV